MSFFDPAAESPDVPILHNKRITVAWIKKMYPDNMYPGMKELTAEELGAAVYNTTRHRMGSEIEFFYADHASVWAASLSRRFADATKKGCVASRWYKPVS
jgi:hypothetical protein